MNNPYDILGVDKNATADQIKKAYRKLAIKYHPDRQAGKSDAEVKKAAEKMAEINAAYEILSDENKRAQFDRYGTIDPNSQNFNSGFDASEIFRQMEENMRNMGGGSMFDDFFGFSGFDNSSDHQSQVEPGENESAQVTVTLGQLINGDKIDCTYSKKIRCKHCHGAGGEGVKECPDCHGYGVKRQIQRTPFGQTIFQSVCNRCGGTGKIVETKCNHCNGTGFELKQTEVKIKLPNDINSSNFVVRLQGYGGESKNPDGPNGDLIVNVHIQFDTNKYAISNNVIYEKLNIPYYDAIIGNKIKKLLPNNETVTITIPQCSDTGNQIVLHNKGINHSSDYVYVLNVIMPTEISDKEKKLLTNIKKLH